MADSPIGHRIRARRRELGRTQTALAAAAGISPSYLNLIEHDRRRVGGAVLRRLADALEIDPQTLSGASESRVLAELEQIGADPVVAGQGFTGEDAAQLLASAPNAAHALLTLYRAYQGALAQVEEMDERLSRDPVLAEASYQILTLITSIRSSAEIMNDYPDLEAAQRSRFLETVVSESATLSGVAQELFDVLDAQAAKRPFASPAHEVDDVIYYNANHFPGLEREAERLRPRLKARGSTLDAAILEELEQRHGITVARRPPSALPPRGHAYDARRRQLLLSEALTAASMRFQLARQLAWLEADGEIAAIARDERLTSEAARRRCRAALASYFAGALLFPYDAFLETAEAERYDVEVLGQRFAASFEQIAHRLTTLRRPEQEGVPFHFLRTDIAGNISKRFSASGLRLPHYGGACPRWVIHQAFLSPGQPVRQVARLQDGTGYLFVARADARPGNGFDTPYGMNAVMIGCDLAFAPRLVYADGLRLRPEDGTPVGISCPLCPRTDCAQRASPQALFAQPDGDADDPLAPIAGTGPDADAPASAAPGDIGARSA